jgi:hypothetical protein
MRKRQRETGQHLVHGCCGAFLAALTALGVQFPWDDINWWAAGGCAAFGFALAWFFGEAAITVLKSVFWWS